LAVFLQQGANVNEIVWLLLMMSCFVSKCSFFTLTWFVFWQLGVSFAYIGRRFIMHVLWAARMLWNF
jgi:hypothetical protein